MKKLTSFLLLVAGCFIATAQLVRVPINDGFEENPTSFTKLNGLTYFIAYHNASGYELWKSDGTTAGTTLVKDINPGGSALVGSQITLYNGEMYFFADDGTHGWELWKSDGTAAGTMLVVDLYPGLPSGNVFSGTTPKPFITANNQYMFFFARDTAGTNDWGLWRSDGTAGGTVFLKTAQTSGYKMLADGNRLFFTANLGATGDEPCITDGTPGGTQTIADVNPGPIGSSANEFAKVGSLVIFAATGPSGREPYITDGTAGGTQLLKNIHPSSNSNPVTFFSFGSLAMFYANDSVHGIEPWVTDGTAANTQLLVDIAVGTSSSASIASTPVYSNGRVFFSSGSQFWASDGTPAGSFRFVPGLAAASTNLTVDNGRVYFIVRNSTYSTDIYSTTTGLDTIRHTFYSTSAINITYTFAGYNCLFVIIKTVIDQLKNLWKLDYGNCSPAVQISGNVPLTCNHHSITLSAGNYSTYSWSTGATGPQLVVNTPGTYSVLVQDTALGCTSADTVTVTMPAGNISVPEICGVSVDSATGKNLIIWNKHTSALSETMYRIEKETATNVFTPVVDIPYDSLSAYADTLADPAVTSYRYRLLLLDSCGNISNPSSAHQTIHLSQNTGIGGEVNLQWNLYVGTSYIQQQVLRSINGGAWVALTTLPGNNVSYTDLTPPAGALEYMIEVLSDSTCTPSRAAYSIFSNRVSHISTGIGYTALAGFTVSPNPATNQLRIEQPAYMPKGYFTLTDVAGKTVHTMQPKEGVIDEDISHLANGIYFVRHSSNTLKPIRFIKQ